jgi:hypothetical protein
MTPEYLDKLADFVDPDHLWKLSGVEQMALAQTPQRATRRRYRDPSTRGPCA